MATLSDEVREKLRDAIGCQECGSRLLTIRQLAESLTALGKGKVKVTESVASSFLRGGTVRSDVLDLMNQLASNPPALGRASEGAIAFPKADERDGS